MAESDRLRIGPAARSNAADGERRWSLVLMGASGFAGLGYQIVWIQQCAVWLGHESAAVLAVVAAFFGGLAAGALTLGPAIERSGYAVRWYAACEAIVAAWSLALLVIMPIYGDRVLVLIGVDASPIRQWTVAFASTFVLLLPATVAMGATLPAVERVVATMRGEGRSIAALYAANTLGAVVGVLSTAFFLIPSIGLKRTDGLCIALSVLCAGTALAVLPRRSAASRAEKALLPSRHAVLARLALTGLFGIGYEVLVVRVLSQVTEDTVYTFAALLAVYLVGTAAGAAWHRRRSVRPDRPAGNDAVDRLLAGLAAGCLLGTAGLYASERLLDALTGLGGTSMSAAIVCECTLAIVAFAVPTFFMGALFSELCAEASRSGVSFGRAIGINIVGATAAPVLFGVTIGPLLGLKGALVLVATGYLAMTTARRWSRPIVLIPAGAAFAMAVFAPALAFIDVPDGGHVVSYRESALAAVSVVEDGDGVSRLRIDNRQQEGSSATRLVDGRQGVIPVLLHPAPHRVLFLGLGTGITATSAAEDASLDIDVVELLPDVIAASAVFTAAIDRGLPASRLHAIAADARRYVRVAPKRYDVIVADNYHPARSGSGALYTAEHFEAISARLAENGLFCQWLPLHQLDLRTLRSIVRSFLSVFPDGHALIANNSLGTPVVGLVASVGWSRFDAGRIRDRLARSGFPETTSAFAIEDEFALLGSFIAGPKALSRFAGEAPENTDDRPVVAYEAPRVTYAPDSLPGDRLIALLNEVSIAPDELVAPGDSLESARLAAYWAARDGFIRAGRDVRPSRDAREMLAQVREPLLAVLRKSPDFRPAYDPLLRMATTLARTDSPAAASLLAELDRIQPMRPEAGLALRRETPSR